VITTWDVDLADGGSAHARFTTRDEGDFAVDAPGVDERRRALAARPWLWLRQVHGGDVVVASDAADAETLAGAEADASVTTVPGLVLAVQTADCGPVALVSPQGVVGAVHVGWRGAEAGVVEAAVEAMRGLGAVDIEAWLGPCIHPECYEFGADDLDRLVGRFGPAVRARARDGAPALDLPMVVARALGALGVRLRGPDRCTGCDASGCFSHRVRGDTGRHALMVWIEDPEPDVGAPS
jgi:polyphenol oxidase